MDPVSGITFDLLHEAWLSIGGEVAALDLVTVVDGNSDLLPSRLAALPAMVAAVSASTTAAATLDAVRRGGRPMPVFVDARHVAVAARSERHARSGSEPPVDLFAPMSRFWRTSDGWIRLHANYPWHRDAALNVLACAGEPEAVKESMAARKAEQLEDELAAAGAVGFAVRSLDEWLAHPQGRAVQGAPLVDVCKGEGGGRRLNGGSVAGGVRVLDLTRVIAGPVATRTLAGWGADVLRIDSPRLPEIPAQTVDTMPGKRSALLDFAEPSHLARLQDLLGSADVLVQSYRPGALDRYGLHPEALRARFPHLAVVTLSAWGLTGPWARRRGFDSVVQAPTGVAALEGEPGRPGTLPAQILDHATGYLAAAAAMLSLAGSALGGPPLSVSLSLARTAQWLMVGVNPYQQSTEVRPGKYTVELSGADEPAYVISPPGMIGEQCPGWVSTTRFGADEPAFLAAGS